LLKFSSNLFIHKCDHSCKIFNQNPTRGDDETKLDWGPRRCCLRSNLKLCQPNKDSWRDINVCILIWHAQRPSTVLIEQNSSQNVLFQVIMKPSNFKNVNVKILGNWWQLQRDPNAKTRVTHKWVSRVNSTLLPTYDYLHPHWCNPKCE
jgi:hypothetical protein